MKKSSSVSKLFILGGGGHASSCAEVIQSKGDFNIIGFIDKDINAPLSKLGYTYLGNDDEILNLIKSGCSVAIGLGQIQSADVRQDVFQSLRLCNAHMPIIKASTSYVSSSSTIGEATIVFHKSVVNIDVRIEENCIINTAAIIEHGCIIGCHTHIAPRAIILGNAEIGKRCFIGAGSVIFQGVNIPDNTIVPAGSIIKQTI